MRAARTCGVVGCPKPGRLMPRGWRCDEHRPPMPTTGYCAPGRCYCTPSVEIRQHLISCGIAQVRHLDPPPPMPLSARARCEGAE